MLARGGARWREGARCGWEISRILIFAVEVQGGGGRNKGGEGRGEEKGGRERRRENEWIEGRGKEGRKEVDEGGKGRREVKNAKGGRGDRREKTYKWKGKKRETGRGEK